jgi:hypothetical protein
MELLSTLRAKRRACCPRVRLALDGNLLLRCARHELAGEPSGCNDAVID